MVKRLRIFGLAPLTLGALATLALAAVGSDLWADERWLLLGRPLLEFRAPKPGQLAPVGSSEVSAVFLAGATRARQAA